ncbi:predicted protein [Lichtheimia corymbifera JMRC:FSU:9682]|uniref:Uncharacterized protein n=1 Tax=Lichtheimia corymbifera JMRC:FSU:9682 TaxID=1263082 RepID=A0A068S3Q7_9FUNG|nr:predicted protein [Lichtheimia corymbifera JMRC:FSU:9682]
MRFYGVRKLAMSKAQTWYSIQDIIIPLLVEAHKNRDTRPNDLILANLLHRASLAMVDRSVDVDLEVSFVYNFISNLFENIFQPEPIFEASWANGHQGGKRSREESTYKRESTCGVYDSKNASD